MEKERMKIEIEVVNLNEKQDEIHMEECNVVVNGKNLYNVRRPRIGNPNFIKSSQPPIDDFLSWCKLLK